jgi:hypothetical protein
METKIICRLPNQTPKTETRFLDQVRNKRDKSATKARRSHKNELVASNIINNIEKISSLKNKRAREREKFLLWGRTTCSSI